MSDLDTNSTGVISLRVSRRAVKKVAITGVVGYLAVTGLANAVSGIGASLLTQADVVSVERSHKGDRLRLAPKPLTVSSPVVDEGVDLNAFYDRNALNFFHGPSPNGTVFSDESPDIVCHEMGHAILNSLKPQLWGVGSHEAAAFHESFGDISAILSALQLQELRTAILSDTGGHLYQSSRLSRLAEQLAAAIRAQQPDAVEIGLATKCGE